jgi:hypothetical protein
MYDCSMTGSRLWLALALYWPSTATADARLDELRATIMEIRGGSLTAGPRGATLRLTVAKHQLRDWIEPRLNDIHSSPGGDARLPALNEELQQAGLLCDWRAPDLQTCPGQTYLGFLERVQFHRSRGFLILETGVGIECGFDESAYLYARSDEGWRRVWQTEQNTYTDKEYKPQSIEAVLVSPYSRANDYLLLTLGTGFGCASVWHNVYYRAFRLGPDQQAGPLLDEEELANVGRDPPIDGSIDRTDVLVQFSGRSIDPSILVRLFVRHYRIEADGVERIDPLALRPRDFVDEWLTHEWREAALWSESENRRSMGQSCKAAQR